MIKSNETMENKILRGAELKEFSKQFYKKVSDDLAEEIGALGTASKADLGIEEGNVPVLGAGGKLNPSVLPAVAVDTMVTVENKEEALTADVQNGDFVRVTADAKVYMVIDDSKDVFEEKFVPLSSVTDSITRGEVQALLDEKVDVATYTQDKATLKGEIDSKVAQAEYDVKVAELETGIAKKVDSATYSADKTKLEEAIAKKVDAETYATDKAELEASIATKVDSDAYATDKAELEGKIDAKVEQTVYEAKVTEIETEMAKKVSEEDYTSDLAELNIKIDAKVAKTDYDAKVAEIEGNVAKKVDSTVYSADKTALEGKIAGKANELVIEEGALKLKAEDGTALSTLNFITADDITDIINSLV